MLQKKMTTKCPSSRIWESQFLYKWMLQQMIKRIFIDLERFLTFFLSEKKSSSQNTMHANMILMQLFMSICRCPYLYMPVLYSPYLYVPNMSIPISVYAWSIYAHICLCTERGHEVSLLNGNNLWVVHLIWILQFLIYTSIGCLNFSYLHIEFYQKFLLS